MKMMKPFLLPPLPSSALSFQEPCGSSPQWCKVKIVQSVRLFEWPQNLSIGLCCVRRDIVLLGDSRVSRRSPLGQTSRLTRTWTCSKKRMFPHFEDLEISIVSLSEPFFSSLKKKKNHNKTDDHGEENIDWEVSSEVSSLGSYFLVMKHD